MKPTMLSSKISKLNKIKVEHNNTLFKGITKILIERYKPRGLENIGPMIKIKDQKRVA